MKPNEIRVNFLSDKIEWNVFKLLASRLMTPKDEGIYPANASDVLRELISEWIEDHAIELFPKILKDFQKSNYENEITQFMRQGLIDYAESARINKNPEDLATLKKSLQNAGFTKIEISQIIKEDEK